MKSANLKEFWEGLESAIDTPHKRREIEQLLREDRLEVLDGVTPFEMIAGIHNRLKEIEPLVPLINMLKDHPEALSAILQATADVLSGDILIFRPYFEQTAANIDKTLE